DGSDGLRARAVRQVPCETRPFVALPDKHILDQPGHQRLGSVCVRALFARLRYPVPLRMGGLKSLPCVRAGRRKSRWHDSSSPLGDASTPYRHRTAAPPIPSNVLSTVCKSKVERLMTFKTSAVAVCCRNDWYSSAPSSSIARRCALSPTNRSCSFKRRAIVVGGSIAGLFTAAFLRRIGWQVEVYERSS